MKNCNVHALYPLHNHGSTRRKNLIQTASSKSSDRNEIQINVHWRTMVANFYADCDWTRVPTKHKSRTPSTIWFIYSKLRRSLIAVARKLRREVEAAVRRERNVYMKGRTVRGMWTRWRVILHIDQRKDYHPAAFSQNCVRSSLRRSLSSVPPVGTQGNSLILSVYTKTPRGRKSEDPATRQLNEQGKQCSPEEQVALFQIIPRRINV